MYRGNRIAVVIPCFNVVQRLPDVLRTVPDFVDYVIVVDDGSRDGTAAAVAHAEIAARPIVMIRHQVNRGLARAMQSGFQRALEIGADIVVKMDGDGQMNPDALSGLLAPIVTGAADISKGNRFLQADHLRGMPFVRLLGNILLSFCAKLTSGYWNVFDPRTGTWRFVDSFSNISISRGSAQATFSKSHCSARHTWLARWFGTRRSKLVTMGSPALCRSAGPRWRFPCSWPAPVRGVSRCSVFCAISPPSPCSS